MGGKSGVGCELDGSPVDQLNENADFSKMARLLLSNAHKFCQWSEQMEAQVSQVALPLRSHTILGVCEAIGEDFGFNPVLLRIPFAASVIYSPLLSIGTYLALGVFVFASRWFFPKAHTAGEQPAIEQPAAANEQRELAEAA